VSMHAWKFRMKIAVEPPPAGPTRQKPREPFPGRIRKVD
jgi:hypothetical protein